MDTDIKLKNYSGVLGVSNDRAWRAGHSTLVIGDFMFVIGGFIEQVPATGGESNVTAAQNLVAIPLNESWSSVDLAARISIFPAPTYVATRPCLFQSPTFNGFYLRPGGFYPNHLKFDSSFYMEHFSTMFWRFEFNKSSGEHSWTNLPAPDGMPALPFEGAFASLNKRGYVFGGLDCPRSFCSWNNATTWVRSDSYQTYSWDSYSTTTKTMPYLRSHLPAPYATDLEVASIPDFGPEGIILLFVEFSTVAIYEPLSKQTFNQSTSGTAPTSRIAFCVGTAKSSTGSYEIIVYGGGSFEYPDPNIYILSIPGFVWFRQTPDPASPRYGHRCEVVGEKYLVSLGGFANVGDVDPNPNDIGVFDITTLQWTNHFKHDASPYSSPGIVQDWYSSAEPSDIDWASPAVRDLFLGSKSLRDFGPQNQSTPGDLAAVSNDRHDLAALVAGPTLGAVALIALLSGLFLWYRRRMTKMRQSAFADANITHTPELPSPGVDYCLGRSELHDERERHETDGEQLVFHMSDDWTQPLEMGDSYVLRETKGTAVLPPAELEART